MLAAWNTIKYDYMISYFDSLQYFSLWCCRIINTHRDLLQTFKFTIKSLIQTNVSGLLLSVCVCHRCSLAALLRLAKRPHVSSLVDSLLVLLRCCEMYPGTQRFLCRLALTSTTKVLRTRTPCGQRQKKGLARDHHIPHPHTTISQHLEAAHRILGSVCGWQIALVGQRHQRDVYGEPF